MGLSCFSQFLGCAHSHDAKDSQTLGAGHAGREPHAVRHRPICRAIDTARAARASTRSDIASLKLTALDRDYSTPPPHYNPAYSGLFVYGGTSQHIMRSAGASPAPAKVSFGHLENRMLYCEQLRCKGSSPSLKQPKPKALHLKASSRQSRL